MTPMEGTEHHFDPFEEKEGFGAISGGPLFSRRLWSTAEKGGWRPKFCGQKALKYLDFAG